MNLGELARSYDPDELKRSVNLAAVVADAGVDLTPVDETRLIGHCPFHSDQVESFAVWMWEDGDTWACGCWACAPFKNNSAAVGDVFDFLQAQYHVSFRQSIELAADYLDKDLPVLPKMPKAKGPVPDLGKMLQEASAQRADLLQELMHARGIHVPETWVRENWRVADGNGEVVIPHFNEQGIITALKHRNPREGWTSRSVRGSHLDHLYGEWRARGGENRPVYLCYADDTEVLTSTGWKLFTDLDHKESVMAWNQEGQCTWEIPIAHQKFDYSGPMVHFSSDFSDLLVTPNHRVISKAVKANPTVRTADTLIGKGGRLLPVAGVHDSVVGSISPTVDQARVIAMFAADGGWTPRNGGALFNVKKDRKKIRIRELLTAIGLTQQPRPGQGNKEKRVGWSEYVHENSTPEWTKFLVHGIEFVRFFLEGENGKLFKWNMIDWTLESRQAFLKELGYWDGDFPGKTGMRFFTVDKHSADVVSAVASVTGWGAIQRVDSHQENDTYVVNLVPRSWRGALFNPPSTQLYNGKVYCVTVPSGFLVTRRNGKVTVSGNCEGESDTWTVSYIFDGDPIDVLGLPSGAAANPKKEWLELVANRDLVLLLDADRAGRGAASKWAMMATGVGAHVRVGNLPDGSDCTSAGFAEVRRAVEEAWPVIDPGSLALVMQEGKYVKFAANGASTSVSDFIMEPTRLIDLNGAIVYEVEVPGKQAVQLVTDLELSSTDRLRRWCAARALSWKGTNRDVSDLLELLKLQSILIPRVRGTNVVGLHSDVFVMPAESIGSTGYAYVPPENDINLGASINIGGRGWDAELPGLLSELHRADVVTPILGWVGAAPLRSLVPKFPVLGVTGGSGYGKTTILEVILNAFGFWTSQPTTLTGATPHGLQSYVGATNSIPIWIDEYRPGARIEAKMALDQIIRDAWDGSATIKGGLHDNRMKIQKLPARAPLVVTGEDTFSETSHAERMLMIDLPKEGRNTDALMKIRALRSPAFGRAYLLWLLDMIRHGSLPTPPNIPDRKTQARAVGWWGYQLLDRFCQELCGYELPEYDGSLAKQAHADIERTPVIVEALIEAIDHTFGDNQLVCWREDDDLIVKIQPFCKRARQMDFALPGGSKAVDKWLAEQYGAYKQMDTVNNRVTVVPGIMAGRDDDE